MEKWVTSDWHLGEDRLGLMSRPFENTEEMIELLVERHNSMVKPDDKVYVLGDVCYQKKPEYLPHVARFNGVKTLVRGNHDRVISDEVFENYFYDIVAEGDGIELRIGDIDCYLTHYPSLGRKDRFNLVGHIHSAWKYQLNMLNIGVDVQNFRPVNLDSIKDHFKAICEYYDNDVWIAYDEINNSYLGKRGKPGNYFKS